MTMTALSPRYWLMKNEPDEYSIDHALAAPQQTIAWDGVRNYQARNFMRDDMQVGDGVLYWHSSCAEPGIYGIARIAGNLRTDDSQFDPASPYFDPKCSPDKPRWLMLDVQALRKVGPITVATLCQYPQLEDMRVLQKGNRLSITPVDARHWDFIMRLIEGRV
ncbi:putative RNA-binding protein with PUA-like domain [Comamonas odontotermitis]|uniref:RNA-binding protein with PUA-like domain n=1 Tax=Comamonas odontotermitis TaxID=379895 RepID=A0ABR6RIF1_9BURK|nr:EVE domain-containing protein [Comamonas odontotermitis]MBB6578814.1 putative RNA-binding protein with PUA-like domain [Comamonas odontotermitis]